MGSGPISVRVLRFVAFLALLPVYAVGGFLWLMCMDDDLEDWPLEARCLLGWTIPLVIPVIGVAMLVSFIWMALTRG